MSKRVLKLFSILFLSSILVLSCSNASKTGSVDNNSGNGGTGTGGTGDGGTGDGGTTPTPQPDGIAKYASTWTATFDGGLTSYNVIIGTDGTVTIKDISEIKAENVQGSGNKYTMSVQHGANVIANVTITFNNDNSGNIDDESIGEGTITKIINE